jgi:hypothetical protein
MRLVIALAYLGASLPLFAEPLLPRDEGRVSLEKGAALVTVLEEVQRAAGVPVLAEVPRVTRELSQPIVDVPLSEALADISSQLEMHFVRRPGSLAALVRYRDPREIADLEVEELASIAEDAARLVTGLVPHPPGEPNIRIKADFYGSLTRAQRELLTSVGLPFAALRPEQQRQWQAINHFHAYHGLALHVAQASELMRGWSRSRMAWRTVPLSGGGESTAFRFQYPASAGQGGVSLINLPDVTTLLEQAEDRQVPAAGALPPSVDERPVLRRQWPAALRRGAPRVAGETTLGELASRFRSTGGIDLRVPEYARDRRLLAFTDEARSHDVATALADMYGWELQLPSARKCTLARPRLGPPQNPLDLQLKLRAVLPPCLHLMWNEEDTPHGRAERFLHHYPLLMQQLFPDGKLVDIATADLKPAEQRRLANLLFDYRFYAAFVQTVNQAQPPYWLTAPEQGVFRLIGEDSGPGSHPMMRFQVPRPDGRWDTWGWAIGTNSLGIR